MAQNKKFKLDIRKIIIGILLLAVIIGVATGKISLANLLGIEPQTDQATWSGEITTEQQTAVPTDPASTAFADITLTHGPIESIDVTLRSAEVPTKTKAETKEETRKETREEKEYYFRYKSYLDEHYEKHGIEMGFPDANAYRKAASDIINSAGDNGILSKYKSDGSGDMCFYVEATKEFVVLSKDGYIRTYFICSGIKYYERQ